MFSGKEYIANAPLPAPLTFLVMYIGSRVNIAGVHIYVFKIYPGPVVSRSI